MKVSEFIDGIADIDDDLIEEASNAGKIKRFSPIKIIAAAACVAVCAVTAIGISDAMKSEPQSEAAVENESETVFNDNMKPVNAEELITETETIPACSPETEGEIGNTAKSGESSSDAYRSAESATAAESGQEETDSDIFGYFCIPAIPASNEVIVSGEQFTDAEAKAYFDKNKASVVSSLSLSGVPSDKIRISENGYSHISYDGSDIKALSLRQNYRDYPVYNGDKLVAIITLIKENGGISCYPAFGAPWFDDCNAFLQNHKGQEMVYVYALNNEIIIAPDGSCYTVADDASLYLEGLENPYEFFYNEKAVYIP